MKKTAKAPPRGAPETGAIQADTTVGALLESCEATFNIEIEADEADSLKTLGDLYDVIRWKCQSQQLGPSACAVARAYRRLRAHLIARGVRAEIKPTSPLEVVFAAHRRREWAALRQAFGPGLPRLGFSDGETILVIMLVAFGLSLGIFGGLYVHDLSGGLLLALTAGLAPVLGTLAVVTAYGLRFARSFPPELKTMADLARATAATAGDLTFLRLRRRRPAAMWDALSDIVRADLGLAGPVTPDLPVDAEPRTRAS